MSVVAAAIIPAAPVLIPELTGREPAAADVRSAALEAMSAMLATEPSEVVIVSEGQPSGWYDPSTPLDLSRIGGPPRDSDDQSALPLPLAIGLRMLRDARWAGAVRLLALEPGVRAEAPALPERTGLLVMANGSARCTEKAPGSHHLGAEKFNDRLVTALRSGDLASTGSIDAHEAGEQWSDAAAPLSLLAAALPGSVSSALTFADVWGGVFYVCGSMTSAERRENG